MSHGQNLQALDLIIDDVLSEINLSVSALESYLKPKNEVQSDTDAVEHLKKLSGIFSLLEMSGAKQLISEVCSLITGLDKHKSNTRAKILEIVSTTLLRLYRYLEHVNSKKFDIPELLLPAINQLRDIARKKQLSESAFFNAKVNKPRKNREVVLITSESAASESRHYRQMYQIGLIEVIRQTNWVGGLKMMQKALVKLDDRCPRPSSPNLWWLASNLLGCFVDESLHLSKVRFKLFSKIDQQMRNIENKNRSLYQNQKMDMDLLANEILYLIWISQSKNKSILSVLSHYTLEPSPLSDASLRGEFIELSGPSKQDYSSLTDATLHELMEIESNLAPAKLANYQPDDLEPAMIQMHSLNNMLKLLQVDDQVIRLSMAIDLIAKSIDNNQVLSNKDVNILYAVIDKVRGSINQSELAKPTNKSDSNRSQLANDKKAIRQTAHLTVKKLMEMMTRFTQNGKRVLQLKAGDQLLSELKHHFAELGVEQAVTIVDQCVVYFINHLRQAPKETSEREINLYADVIASLEFYLETLEFTATPSDKILNFAESSLQALKSSKKKRVIVK